MEKTNSKIEEKSSCWYAVYAAARAEESVKQRLDEAGIENYLPLQAVIRSWDNCKRRVMIPVIPGFIFVHLPIGDIAKVKSIEGVSFLLREEEKYVSIPDSQMDIFRNMVENTSELLEFAEELTSSITVRIICGQLKGVIGELADYQGKNKLMLRIPGLGCALATVTSGSVEEIK